MKFHDRSEAGRRLAERLLHLKDARSVVYALPRGGVPIAEALDLLLVRKIGAPGQLELALGTVVEGEPPQTVVNGEIIELLGVPADFVTEQAADQLAEIEHPRRLWLRGRAPVSPYDRTAILVDDGVATGARRVLAMPVAPPEVVGALREDCDEAVFLAEPALFGSVGAFCDDFSRIEDAEVTALLDGAAAWRQAG